MTKGERIMTERGSTFAQLPESDFSRFLQGFFGFFCGIVALLLFSFSPSLTLDIFGAQGIPCGAISIAATALLLPLLRVESDYFDTDRGKNTLELVAFVGLALAPLGIATPLLALPCSILFAGGIVSASALWVVFLIQFDYQLLTLFVGSAFALASVTTATASLIQAKIGTVLFVCTLMLVSLVCLKSCRKSNPSETDFQPDFLSKQARTARIDRWTYSFIGLNLGVALTLSFNIVNSESFTLIEAEPIFQGIAIFAPILCASTLVLAFRTTYSYLIEKYSKDFFAATIAAGVMLLSSNVQILVAAGLFVLLCAVFLQLIIVVNASIGFIRIQKLSPSWYLAEEAFVAGGTAAGILLTQAFTLSAPYFPNPNLPFFLLLAINSFLQVFTNRGAFPVQTQALCPEETQNNTSQRPDTRKDADESIGKEEVPVKNDEETLPSVFRNIHSEKDNGGGLWRAKVNYCCQQYKLSPRQCEIFVLLARGRDVKYIEEKLVISHATAKSHIYNIYLKLDVHSRQELIDLVENAPLQKDEPTKETRETEDEREMPENEQE